jgi:hypothetical protein
MPINLTDLPSEILVQIMSSYQYIRHVLHFSAACRLTQQIWRKNAATIACHVFSFLPSELLEILYLARLETLMHGEILPDLDLNAAVCKHIRSLARIYSGANALVWIGNEESLNWPIPPGPAQLRYCIPMMILLFRFAVGFDHTILLPGAYKTLHSNSDKDAYFYRSIISRFAQKRHRWREIVPLTAQSNAAHLAHHTPLIHDHSPLPWRFAVQVFFYDCYGRSPSSWLVSAEGEGEIADTTTLAGNRKRRAGWEYLETRFGRERVRRMFGVEEGPGREE